MARWVWPTAAGVVTSATGVVINLATDQVGNPWTWIAVVLLTAAGVFVGLAAQRADAAPPGEVHNTITGTVHGSAVQAGTLGAVTLNSGAVSAGSTVSQTATARDGSTVHQAGRDVRHETGPGFGQDTRHDRGP
ncbi:hypothetical protein AB0I60_32640 [Actinosynnema sp. NPDC050436]|uniref:hypothetical protein n=1 Tax=Actinosynnema sp. NPDC050436 TaxID=3155659 RepID=UPI0033EF0BB5